MGILFSVGDLGDPFYLQKKIKESVKPLPEFKAPELTNEEIERNLSMHFHKEVEVFLKGGAIICTELDDEVRRYKVWRKGVLENIIEISEEGDLEKLNEYQDKALKFEAALIYTLNNTSRSRLSQNALKLFKDELSNDIELVKSANDIIKRRIEVSSKQDKFKSNPKPLNVFKGQSYYWVKSDQLPKLYSKLLGAWISHETELNHFIDVFSHKPIHEIVPIRWLSGNASELLYFISECINERHILIERDTFDYKQIKSCFKKNDGSEFTASFKNLKTKAACGLGDDKSYALDSLLKSFATDNK